jgi:hypothetical protein
VAKTIHLPDPDKRRDLIRSVAAVLASARQRRDQRVRLAETPAQAEPPATTPKTPAKKVRPRAVKR